MALTQTAVQVWCLIQNLPFLLGDIVNPESLHWQLFILLREICSIIFAPVVTKGLAVFLKQLIIDHQKLFKELYPFWNLIPKHHFMIHYPSMMIQFGPLCKTLAYKNQVQHMYCYKFGDPLDLKICVPNAYNVVVRSLKYADQISEEMSSFADEATETVMCPTQ